MNITREQIEKQIRLLRQRTFFDPTLDRVFKKIFSKDVTLIHFLNAMLRFEGERKIVSIARRKPSVRLSAKIGSEEVRFDLHARLGNGEYIDLEMQRAYHDDLFDRMELYAAQLAINSKIDFDNERTCEEKEERPYQMPRTYAVWLCSFDVPFCNGYREEIGLFRFSDIGDEKARAIYDKKRYIIVDLTKYREERKPTGPEAEWLELFTKMATATKCPDNVDSVIADVYRRLAIAESTETFIAEVAENMMTETDIKMYIAAAKRKGLEEGRAEGRAEGREKGLAEGRVEGREKGLAEGRVEGREKAEKEKLITARELYADGVSIDILVHRFNLPREQILEK